MSFPRVPSPESRVPAFRTRVKFCGITRAEDVAAAARLGADAIGLVLDRGSPRFISPPTAAMLRRRLPPFVQAVALVRNAERSEIQEIIRSVQPDLIQFHGDEPPEFCASFGVRYVKAVSMSDPQDLTAWAARYSDAAALLLDSHAKGEPGGQGRTFDWSRIVRSLKRPIVLAGGLTPDNVFDAVRRVRPFAVDVSSGIEAAPGAKDETRMRRFIEEVRRGDAA